MPCFFLYAVGMARRLLGLTQVDAAQLSGASPRRESALGPALRCATELRYVFNRDARV
jgi:hypothetical protein